MGNTTRRNPTTNGNGDNVNVDAERAVLGAMLFSTEATRDGVKICTADDFAVPSHQHVFGAIVDLVATGQGVDALTIVDHLERQGLADQAPPLADLLSMVVNVPTSNVARYARVVTERARLRRLAIAAEEVRLLAAAADGDVDTIITKAGKLLAEATGGARNRRRLTSEHEQVAAAARGDVPPIVPTLLFRSDGQALLYPASTNAISAEPGKGKTWLAITATVEALNTHQPVLWMDYESTPSRIGERMAALGVNHDRIADGLLYVRPPVIGPAERAELADMAVEHRPVLAVLDGMARAIARQGGDEDKAAFVLDLFEIVRPIVEAGAALLILDHVTKAKDGRGRWARGSGSKLGEIEGVAYGLEVQQSWSRTTPGWANLIIAKDREGVIGAEGDTAAIVRVRPSAEGLTITVDPPAGEPVDCAAGILRVLTERGGELGRNQLIDAMRLYGMQFRDATISETAERLASAGRIRVRKGANRARLYSSSEGDQDSTLVEERW